MAGQGSHSASASRSANCSIASSMQTVSLSPWLTARVVKHWLRFVCEMATEQRMFVMLSCDTAEQAERAAKMVAKWLPQHRRVALERMYEAASRARGRLG